MSASCCMALHIYFWHNTFYITGFPDDDQVWSRHVASPGTQSNVPPIKLLILNQRQWHVSGTVCVTTVVPWQWQQCQQWDNYKTLAQSFRYDTGSAVGIVTRFDLRNSKISFDSRWQRRGTYLLPKRADRLWGPQCVLSAPPGVKRPGREADYSSPSVVEVRNEQSYTGTSYSFLAAEGLMDI